MQAAVFILNHPFMLLGIECLIPIITTLSKKEMTKWRLLIRILVNLIICKIINNLGMLKCYISVL